VQTNEAKSKRRRASPTQTTSQRDNTPASRCLPSRRVLLAAEEELYLQSKTRKRVQTNEAEEEEEEEDFNQRPQNVRDSCKAEPAASLSTNAQTKWPSCPVAP